MLISALVLFAVAAAIGLTLAMRHLRSGISEPAPPPGATVETPPRQVSVGLAVGHGIFAVLGLFFLILAAARGVATGLALVALAIFVLTALGGVFLFLNHFLRNPLPRPMIFVHGGAAAVAFVLLLVFVLAA